MIHFPYKVNIMTPGYVRLEYSIRFHYVWNQQVCACTVRMCVDSWQYCAANLLLREFQTLDDYFRRLLSHCSFCSASLARMYRLITHCWSVVNFNSLVAGLNELSVCISPHRNLYSHRVGICCLKWQSQLSSIRYQIFLIEYS